MKFKLTVSAEDAVEILKEFGYGQNIWGKQRPLKFEEPLEAIKIFEGNVAVAIDILTQTNEVNVDVYRFVGDKDAHKKVNSVKSYKPYVEELDGLWVAK